MSPYKPEVHAYLERIGYRGPIDGSLVMLRKLQECHLHTVPYENLDIIHGIPLSLEIPDLYDKIVTRQRGGYCFELNALFGWLLRELGFHVTDLVARFWRDESAPPPKRRHHVLKVGVEGEDASYLCDVGVGGIVPRQPIKLVKEVSQEQGSEIYRMAYDPLYGWVLCEWKKDEWLWIYSFTEEPQNAKDFIFASYWCEHSSDSIFKQSVMLSLRSRDGRYTVAGEEFRIFSSDGISTFIPTGIEAYNEALSKYFGISMSSSTEKVHSLE